MLPPEVIDPGEFGPIDHRSDIFHCGLLLLQLARSRELKFTKEQMLDGEPRKMASELPEPLNFALGKALIRHASKRTASALELWRDLNAPGPGATALIPRATEAHSVAVAPEPAAPKPAGG